MTVPDNVLVDAKDLCKAYGGVTAVDRVSFRVSEGNILGLLGANGAGKTTTLHMVLGLLKPTSGEVRVMGRSPFREHGVIAESVNFSSAYGNLPLNLTLSENLTIYARLYGVRDFRKKIAELLEMFELSHLSGRVAGALSSGERTKLNLAKGLLNDPRLLVLDEPTASLDPDMADKVRKLLKNIQRERGIGIIYTSHNMYEVEELCDEIVFIHKGKVIAGGTPKKIREAFSGETLEQAFIKIVRGNIVCGDEPC